MKRSRRDIRDTHAVASRVHRRPPNWCMVVVCSAVWFGVGVFFGARAATRIEVHIHPETAPQIAPTPHQPPHGAPTMRTDREVRSIICRDIEGLDVLRETRSAAQRATGVMRLALPHHQHPTTGAGSAIPSTTRRNAASCVAGSPPAPGRVAALTGRRDALPRFATYPTSRG